jgi:DNA-directed RNA polymerase specialized sigma24 family protein
MGKSYNDLRVPRSRWLSVAMPLTPAPTLLEHIIAVQSVTAALKRISSVQREAIMLAYFDALTCEEIAILTKAPLRTVKIRLRSALRARKRTAPTRIAKSHKHEEALGYY